MRIENKSENEITTFNRQIKLTLFDLVVGPYNERNEVKTNKDPLILYPLYIYCLLYQRMSDVCRPPTWHL